ncbi:hypothetical protein BT96DRAFT_1006398 [Gymnopus androsaceus JB14]|uniref:G-protein coupled receptors family 1 profile domain-containing protein n=1 Tax=Gymnopus androsaceus JB14 TaxID=1447944 RepID=A0A6A4GKP3_9AGAR|nr:hypothetical protein BT96DRAFT_1006398 [Gymnopus androsaceus JB14]
MATTTTKGAVIAFNVIETIGFVSAFAIIVTASLSSSIRRLPTWYLVLCSGAVYSFSKLLLAMAHAQLGPEPPFTLCLVQGVLIYSAPIGLMASACAFALQFHLTVLFYIKQYSGIITRESKWITLSPVILYVAVTVALFITGAVQPQIVQRSPEQVYCHFTNNIGVYAVSVFSVLFAIGAVAFEYKSGKLLYRHWKQKSDLSRRSNGAVSIGVMVRLATFSLVSILSVATCTLYMLPNISNFDDIVLYNSVLPNVAIILLGLNKSVIRVWMFWKKDANPVQNDEAPKMERSEV